MSHASQQFYTPPEEHLPLGYDEGVTHWDDATYGMLIPGYEDLNLGYTADIPTELPLQPIYMEDLFASSLSPMDAQHSSPLTLCGEPLWPSGSEFEENSPENYFSFESSPASSADIPTSPLTLSPGGHIPTTPASLEPSSPPPPAPEPVQNPDGTWACPQAGCTHPGHKRRCDARKHHKSHTKPYACRVRTCEYRSSNAKDRERHYDTRHSERRHPACPAPGCGVLKSRIDNMRDHIKRRHPGMDSRNPEIAALYPRRGRS